MRASCATSSSTRTITPLARSAELLDILADLEARGLVVSELHFQLTAAGRAALETAGD